MDSMPMDIHFTARRLNEVNEFIWTGGGLNLFKLLLMYSGPSALASVSCSAELKPSESDQMQSSCPYIEVNVRFKAVNDEITL
jgi:hypothetical protein